ncbi:unnamed protein product [Heterobilharzia americana]|nr:unnamed protein product [Heterobilharzia americana]
MFLKLLNSLHICTLIICTSLLHSHGAENFSHGAHGVLIANTVDGSFVGVDIESGREVWRIDGPPLVSQSLSDLQLMTKTKSYSIVPSLEGQLFLMERRITGDLELSQEASLKALPLNIDSLFSSNFMLTEDSILTGGRDHSTFAFNPHDGKIKYNCTRDGCSSSDTDRKFSDETSYAKGPMIIAYRVNNIVRAISAPVGIEKWNLSVYQYDLCLLTGRIPTPTAAVQKPLPICNMPLNTPNIHGDFMDESFVDVDEPDWDFGLEKRMITARTKDTHPEDLWSFNFSSRISKAWIYRRDLQSLRSLSLFTYDRAAVLLVEKLNESKEKTFTVRNFGLLKEKGLNLLNRKRTHFSTNKEKNKCPSHDRLIYLGSLNGQLYVQVGDGADLPSPDMINLSKSLSVPSGGLLDEHGVPGYSSLIGYYHASYSKSPKLRTSIQPFLSDDNVEETIEKATALGFPNSVGQFKHIIGFQPDTSNEQIVSQSNSADVDASDGSSGLPERIFDSANDLIMLLLRASEIAINHSPIDTESGRSLGFSLSTHFIQLIVVAGMLYFTAQWIMNVKITYDTHSYKPSKAYSDDDSLIVFENNCSSETLSCTDSDIPKHSVDKKILKAQHKNEVKYTCYLYIQMQLCSPKSLRDWLVAHSLPESRPLRAELICMFRQIVDAVSYLHNHSLMHRDLKPSNILFDLTNRLKLADFGLVTSMLDEKLNQKDASFISYSNQNNQSLYSEMTTENRSIHNAEHNNFADRQIHPLKDISSVQQKRSVFARRHTDHVGTDLYMSPEQERGDNYNHKVDIFSLGLIFLELLITFSTSMERIYTLTRAKQQKLPKDFITCNPVETEFVLKLLDFNPFNRPDAPEILECALIKQCVS